MAEHYLSDRIYFRLARTLPECRDIEAVKEALGRAGIWPKSVELDLERDAASAEKARQRLARKAA